MLIVPAPRGVSVPAAVPFTCRVARRLIVMVPLQPFAFWLLTATVPLPAATVWTFPMGEPTTRAVDGLFRVVSAFAALSVRTPVPPSRTTLPVAALMLPVRVVFDA